MIERLLTSSTPSIPPVPLPGFPFRTQQTRFGQVADAIGDRVDAMNSRIDDLEKAVQELMVQVRQRKASSSWDCLRRPSRRRARVYVPFCIRESREAEQGSEEGRHPRSPP